MQRRAVVYVDGFNLDYGALRGGPRKWLDLERYFTLLRKDDDIRRIYYFTALIDGPRSPNQQAYLRALAQRPLVETVLEQFKRKKVRCNVKACTYKGSRTFVSQEEKRTDVNIGIQMLDDAYCDECDLLVLVSGDSDLVPAVDTVKTRFPDKRVIVYVPTRNRTRGAAVELRAAADQNRSLPLGLLARAQFPTSVPDGCGGQINKPADW